MDSAPHAAVPRGRFHADRRENVPNRGGSGPSSPIPSGATPAAHPGSPFPGKRGAWHPGIDDSWPLRNPCRTGYRQTLNPLLESLAMANAQCRTCDRAANSGAYCSSCAADIMANALKPFYGGQRKKFPLQQGKFPTRLEPTSSRRSSQPRLLGS